MPLPFLAARSHAAAVTAVHISHDAHFYWNRANTVMFLEPLDRTASEIHVTVNGRKAEPLLDAAGRVTGIRFTVYLSNHNPKRQTMTVELLARGSHRLLASFELQPAPYKGKNMRVFLPTDNPATLHVMLSPDERYLVTKHSVRIAECAFTLHRVTADNSRLVITELSRLPIPAQALGMLKSVEHDGDGTVTVVTSSAFDCDDVETRRYGEYKCRPHFELRQSLKLRKCDDACFNRKCAAFLQYKLVTIYSRQDWSKAVFTVVVPSSFRFRLFPNSKAVSGKLRRFQREWRGWKQNVADRTLILENSKLSPALLSHAGGYSEVSAPHFEDCLALEGSRVWSLPWKVTE